MKEGLVEGLDDSIYIRGLRERLQQNRALWEIQSETPLDIIVLQQFLELLSNKNQLEALPAALRGPEAENVRIEFQEARRRFDYDNTVVGHLHNFPRLTLIVARVDSWATTPEASPQMISSTADGSSDGSPLTPTSELSDVAPIDDIAG